VASLAVAIGFRGAALARRPEKGDLSVLSHRYRTIFANPNARVCFIAVFIEGCCVLGLFPYVAAFLFELGVTSLSIQQTLGGSPRHCAVAAFVLLFPGPDHRFDRIWLQHTLLVRAVVIIAPGILRARFLR
jgi:hypothetical protein